MNDKFLSELARRLRQEGIATGEAQDDLLSVLMNGQETMWIAPTGAIFLSSRLADDPECAKLYHRVAGVSAQVHEYTTAMASAPRLEAVGLHEDFRLLANFNGVILAGLELERNWGYKFVTWRRDGNGTGVAHGNYYHNDYVGAKLDFACRSGLVQDSRPDGAPTKAPFSFRGERRDKGAQCGMPEGCSTRNGLCLDEEQLAEMYRCIHETLDSGYPITQEREKTLTAAAEQIARCVDDLNQRVEQSNQRELVAAQEQATGPALGF